MADPNFPIPCYYYQTCPPPYAFHHFQPPDYSPPIAPYVYHQPQPPPAPPNPQLHPFYTSQVSSPSIIPQFHTIGGIAPQVFDEYSVRSCVSTHTPAAYTSPYNLAIQTTLSTGQPFYVIESTTAEGYENVSSFGELRHVITWFNTGNETVEATCEILDESGMRNELGIEKLDRLVSEVISDIYEVDGRGETETEVACEVEALKEIESEMELKSEVEATNYADNGKAIEKKHQKEISLFEGRFQSCLRELRSRACDFEDDRRGMKIKKVYWENLKLHIASYNNFPTIAGLAFFVSALAKLMNLKEDHSQPSAIARQGSGSACRSLFGGFVKWIMGKEENESDSIAVQLADENHWDDLVIVIAVVSARQKETSSTSGMQDSCKTSMLIQHRAKEVVPKRVIQIEEAIGKHDFSSFARLACADNSQFHAVCLDTSPPIFYMNDTSHKIISCVEKWNRFEGTSQVAYTFDAWPNAVIIARNRKTAALLLQRLLERKDKDAIFSFVEVTSKQESVIKDDWNGLSYLPLNATQAVALDLGLVSQLIAQVQAQDWKYASGLKLKSFMKIQQVRTLFDTGWNQVMKDCYALVRFLLGTEGALCITDGALIVVDCIVGVCGQPETVLRQAQCERIPHILTVNEMDRCFLNLPVDGEVAYQTYQGVIENAMKFGEKNVLIFDPGAKTSVKVFDPGGCSCWRDDGARGTNCRIHILEDKDILKGKQL